MTDDSGMVRQVKKEKHWGRVLALVGALLLVSWSPGCAPSPTIFELPPLNPDQYKGPHVTAADPLPGRQGVPIDYPVRVTISEEVRASSVPGAVTVHSETLGPLPHVVTLKGDGRTLAIRAAWPPDDAILISIDAKLVNHAGFPLIDQDPSQRPAYTPYRLTFLTGRGKLSEPPRVLSVDPLPGEQEISPFVEPVIRFSKRMGDERLTLLFEGPDGPVGWDYRWERDHTALRILSQEELAWGAYYQLTLLDLADEWRQPLGTPRPPDLAFFTRKLNGTIVINEVVTSPQRDWNDSSGGNGIAFDPIPGTGAVTSTDEFIELYNGSAYALDLRGWSLEMNDGTDEIHFFGGGSTVVEYFSRESSHVGNFESGSYLVVGNPPGNLRNTVHIILRDAHGVERDSVTIGTHGVPDGRSTGTHDEAVARIPNGHDSGIPADDWQKVPATPGARNMQAPE